MRSQLDCQDHRLPGTGVFDLKTRASASIRMDLLNFEASNIRFVVTIADFPQDELRLPHKSIIWH